MTVKEFLKTGSNLLFDGGMGTYYSTLHSGGKSEYAELALFNHPERITEIHREYIAAGAKAIKTNSFSALSASLESFSSVNDIVEKSWNAANEAVKAEGKDVFIFADIGYMGENADDYLNIAKAFLSFGAENFLFETLSSINMIKNAIEFIKSQNSDAFIIASIAAQPDGFTRTGKAVFELLDELEANENIDAIGLNCIAGPTHLLSLLNKLPQYKKPISIMPNSGYPSIIAGRTYFPDSAEYFATQLAKIAKTAQIIGGCCGTTPEHIAFAANLINTVTHKKTERVILHSEGKKTISGGDFMNKLRSGQKVIAVELDPPADADIKRFIEGAKLLKEKSVDAITIADCPVARVRADSSMLAAKLKRELDIYTIPHMTCRDRNINASKALLLGLGIEGVESVLVVTGDPIPNANRDEIKAVFSFNSTVFARYIKNLGEKTGKVFSVGGALNVNAPNFTAELKKAQRKEESGIEFFLTQPIFTNRAIENLKLAKEKLNGFILGGIIPVISYRNGLFMKNEMSGIDIPDEIVLQYKDLDRPQGQELAISISLSIAEKIRDYCDGFYLITPFGRAEIVAEIIDGIKEN